MLTSDSDPQSPIRLVITQGEPAGIGISLLAQILEDGHWRPQAAGPIEITILGDQWSLMRELKASHKMLAIENTPDFSVHFLDRRPPVHPQRGKLNVQNAPFVIDLLDEALDGLKGQTPLWDGLVTLPVHKGILNDAGFSFSGHTEYLAQNQGPTVMCFDSPFARIALATTHIPLQAVSGTLNAERLRTAIVLWGQSLERDFGIQNPRIGILGLNPHAGEHGYLGTEETHWINPLIEELQSQYPNWVLTGPLAADTAFIPSLRAKQDAWVSLYHDQALPVLKAFSFDETVNVTLGLPFVRTSPDHGTALELALQGKMPSAQSFKNSIQTACQLIENRKAVPA